MSNHKTIIVLRNTAIIYFSFFALLLIISLTSCNKNCLKSIEKAKAKCPELFIKDTVNTITTVTVNGYVLSAIGSALSPCEELLKNRSNGDTLNKEEIVLTEIVNTITGVKVKTTMQLGTGRIKTTFKQDTVFFTKHIQVPCECIITKKHVKEYLKLRAKYAWEKVGRWSKWVLVIGVIAVIVGGALRLALKR